MTRNLSAILGTTLLLAASCSSGAKHSIAPNPSTTTTVGATRHFDFAKYGVSFDYPSQWHVDPYDVNEHYTQILGYVSNEKLHYPCTTTSNSVDCGYPLDRLRPDGVLVIWSTYSGLGGRFVRTRGEPLTLSGHEARLESSQNGCPSPHLGAARGLAATVLLRSYEAADTTLTMTACLGPEALASEPKVIAMLKSLRLQ